MVREEMVVLMKMFTLLVAVAAVLIEATMAANYSVGAPGGSWDLQTDLQAWASARVFTLVTIGNRTPEHCLAGMKLEIITLEWFLRKAAHAPSPATPPLLQAPSPPSPAAIFRLLVVLSLLVFFCRKKRRRDQSKHNHNPAPPPLGGFGYVHRGVLPNGKEVAVKQLKVGSEQGECEFQAEVEIISRLHHKHLVSLVGYCMSKSDRLLVYEFVPNNTMEFHLHGKGRPVMDWPTRLKIALGSAKGLAYLHEDCHPKIIHRDIKAANILLGLEFDAKVADFGLAKFFSDVNTHVSTRVKGTFGYLAPEYTSSGKLTEKSDVFSFGVMLLELITGRRPIDMNCTYMDDSLVDWARPLLARTLEEGNFSTLVDVRLKDDYDHDEMLRMVSCAAASVRHSARHRPRMSQIVRALEGNISLSDLNQGIKPGHSTVYSSYGSSDYDASQYNKDMNTIRKMGSSENPTSEYSSNPSGSSSEDQNTRDVEMEKTK